MIRKKSNVLLLCALFVLTAPVTRLLAQTSETQVSVPSSVHDYVQQTREIGPSDYSVIFSSTSEQLVLYRVTVSSNVTEIAAFERVFDVSVESATGRVVGEYVIRTP